MSLPCKINPLGVYRLPVGYLPASFLESTGTQYIDTGIKTSADICSEGVYYQSPEDIESSAWHQYLFGCGLDTSNFAFLAVNRDVLSHIYYYRTRPSVRGQRPAGKITFLCDTSGMELNGTRYEFSSTVELTESVDACCLFARGDGVSSVWGHAKAKVFAFTLSISGAPQANYIPAIDAQGVPCMFDKITKQPFYNSGTGAFIVGMTAAQARRLGKLPTGGGTLTISLPSEVVDENGVLQDMAIFTALSAAAAKGWSFILQTHDGTAVETAVPAGYMECDFLESTGTQYIDTGIKTSADICSEGVYYQSPEDIESSAWHQYLFGCGLDTSNFAFLAVNRDGLSHIYYYRTRPSVRGQRPAGKIAFLCDTSGMELNGTRYEFSSTVELTDSVDTCRLFVRSDGGSTVWGHAKAKVFAFTLSSSGAPQANYTPAITPDGIPCMYDKVSGEAKLNSGTGAFIVGMTAAQAVQLANLPAGGGELTVSLPQAILNDDGEITDAAVRAALNKAAENGWDITLQYYTN